MLMLIKRQLEIPLKTHRGRSFKIPADLTMGKHMNKDAGIDISFTDNFVDDLKNSWEKLSNVG